MWCLHSCVNHPAVYLFIDRLMHALMCPVILSKVEGEKERGIVRYMRVRGDWRERAGQRVQDHQRGRKRGLGLPRVRGPAVRTEDS